LADFAGVETVAPPSGEAWSCVAGQGSCQPLSQQSTEPLAPFEIKSTAGEDYLLKLTKSSTEWIYIFVRGGSDPTVDVPLGTYTVTYAAGAHWYGYRADNRFFGPETAYIRADRTFSFNMDGNRLEGVSVTLYAVLYGNLRTHTIPPDEF
jgi:hypothetical protein